MVARPTERRQVMSDTIEITGEEDDSKGSYHMLVDATRLR